jgi:microcompartment protein CcmL/EutN
MDTDQVTQPTPSTDAGAQAANTIMELESMIKNSVSTIERNKEELKKLREMVDSALTNDEGYREAAEKAKEAVKAKSKAKVNVMQNQATKNLAAKAKDLSVEVKEANLGLSEYLREYQRMTGQSEIEGDDGEVREIVYTAKLIKKQKKF